MTAPAQDNRVQRSGDAVAAALGNSLLILNMKKGLYHSLNGVAAQIWELLEHPVTPAAIVQELTTQYEVAADLCAEHVVLFLADLRKRGLLQDGRRPPEPTE